MSDERLIVKLGPKVVLPRDMWPANRDLRENLRAAFNEALVEAVEEFQRDILWRRWDPGPGIRGDW